jgi:hypothetical protein
MKHFELTPEIAYILGVYFSDGCINKHSGGYLRFCFGCIDKDFAEKVAKHLEIILKKEVRVLEQNRGNKRQLMYNVYTNCTDFCEWVLEITKFKTLIPKDIYSSIPIIKHNFISGFLDGDGYIGKNKVKNFTTFRYQIGYCSTDLNFCNQFNELVSSVGVQIRSKKQSIVGSYENSTIPVHHFRFNVISFLRSGCNFTIKRKEIRLLECFKLLPQRLDAKHLLSINKINK